MGEKDIFHRAVSEESRIIHEGLFRCARVFEGAADKKTVTFHRN